MAKGDYEFPILVTCLLILALQIHNPFQPARVCECDGTQPSSRAATGRGSETPAASSASRSGKQAPPQAQSPATAYRKPSEVSRGSSASGLSTDELLRELDSIQVKAKEQQETLAAAGKMPPASPILQQLKESEAGLASQERAPAPVDYGRGNMDMSAGLDMGGAGYGRGGQGMGAMPPAMPPAQPVAAQSMGAQPNGQVMVQRRDDLGRFLNQQQPQGLGIVLGVGRGDFALRLLSDWTSTQGVYLVDPYIHIWRGYDDAANLQDVEHQRVFEELRNRLQMFEGRHVVVRDFSHSFCEVYQRGGQPGPPTFIYIDANHAEQAVTRDIELWWPVLSAGGIIAGSTYMDDAQGRIRVRAAVDKFATRLRLQVHVTEGDATPSWFMMKQ